MKRKLEVSEVIFKIVSYVLLTAFALCCLYPFVYAISASISGYEAVEYNQIILLPKNIQFDAFKYVLQGSSGNGFWNSYTNTLFMTFYGTIWALGVAILGGYALSKKRLLFRKGFNFFLVFTMWFSAGIVPQYRNYLATQDVFHFIGIMDDKWLIVIAMGRGGKEAIESNKALANSVRRGLEGLGSLEGLADAIQLVEILEHEAVSELVRSVGLIDVAIPRGGERLIRAMCEAALIPVLKHYKGVCHIYVDDEADLGMALAILDNAKVQRPGVCNAAECLLIHKKLAPLFRPMVEAWAKDKGVTLHENEAGTEYLSLDINVAVVDDYRAAIDFINENSSHHSECIVTNNAARAKEFLRDVDSACVYHNVSTRFTDGGEFGMGAEIGISTDKLHARGPMGLEELTTYKYTVTGDGVIRQ